jgi:hypothetical protein
MRKCLSTVSTPNAVQQRNGSYWRVCEPLTLDRIATHLLGRWTLGTYLLDQYSCCSFAVFDADGPDGLERLVGLSAELAEQGIPTLLEASRRGGHLWVHLAGSTPARHVRAWCRSQDIASVIGRYVTLDHRGVGSCPFKDHHHRGDRRPSFQVFGGCDPHWYCYTWRRAGDLFTFLCLYHGISLHEGWERLQRGTLLM